METVGNKCFQAHTETAVSLTGISSSAVCLYIDTVWLVSR